MKPDYRFHLQVRSGKGILELVIIVRNKRKREGQNDKFPPQFEKANQTRTKERCDYLKLL